VNFQNRLLGLYPKIEQHLHIIYATTMEAV
jgi:hypothetical protein